MRSELKCFIPSKCSTMLQKHTLMGLFLICEHFPAKTGGFVATGSRKISALKQQQLKPAFYKVGHCNLKFLANTIISGCYSGKP